MPSKQLSITLGDAYVPVASLAEASQRWQLYKSEHGGSCSLALPGADVCDAKGSVVAHVSFNGDVWSPGPRKPHEPTLLSAAGFTQPMGTFYGSFRGDTLRLFGQCNQELDIERCRDVRLDKENALTEAQVQALIASRRHTYYPRGRLFR